MVVKFAEDHIVCCMSSPCLDSDVVSLFYTFTQSNDGTVAVLEKVEEGC